jgi:hypothetical protein
VVESQLLNRRTDISPSNINRFSRFDLDSIES